ncbi:MAG: Uma2 family endonuclease [Saprospiraceae bacterium]
MITRIDQLNPDGYYTYSDYILWKFQERVEILKGKIFPMSAPSVKHQRLSGDLQFIIRQYIIKSENNCEVFTAPFDVRLPLPTNKILTNKIDTVVQPDLCIVCDKSKLDEKGCIGAPELIVEILSLGNSKREMKSKFELYENAGVLEYWVIDPEHNLAFIYFLDQQSKKFIPSLAFSDEDIINSKIFTNLSVNLEELFKNK